MSSKAADSALVLQGTLDLIVLRALDTMGPLHAYALTTRLAQVSDHSLTLNQGTLIRRSCASNSTGSSRAPGQDRQEP